MKKASAGERLICGAPRYRSAPRRGGGLREGSHPSASRILARPDAVKGRRGRRRPRWLQIPEWLMDLLLETCPPEDRLADRPLIPWLNRLEHPRQAANKTMSNACKAAGIPHFHPQCSCLAER